MGHRSLRNAVCSEILNKIIKVLKLYLNKNPSCFVSRFEIFSGVDYRDIVRKIKYIV